MLTTSQNVSTKPRPLSEDILTVNKAVKRSNLWHTCWGLPFKAGNPVWLHCLAVPRGQPRKFHQPWQGPFIVVTVLSDITYYCITSTMIIHNNHLRPYYSTPVPQEYQRPKLMDKIPWVYHQNTQDLPHYHLLWRLVIARRRNCGQLQNKIVQMVLQTHHLGERKDLMSS